MRRSIAGVIGAALLAGACGGSGPTPAVAPVVAPSTLTASGGLTPSPIASLVSAPPSTPEVEPSRTPVPIAESGLALMPGGHSGRVFPPDQAFAVTLPDGWQTIPVRGDLGPIASIAPAGTVSDEALRLWRASLALDGVSFIAVDVDALARDGSLRAVSLVRVPVGTDMTMEQAAEQFLKGIQGGSNIEGKITQTHLALPAGPAERFEMRTVTSGSIFGADADFTGFAYITVQSPNFWMLSCMTPTKDRDVGLVQFEAIAKSLLIL